MQQSKCPQSCHEYFSLLQIRILAVTLYVPKGVFTSECLWPSSEVKSVFLPTNRMGWKRHQCHLVPNGTVNVTDLCYRFGANHETCKAWTKCFSVQNEVAQIKFSRPGQLLVFLAEYTEMEFGSFIKYWMGSVLWPVPAGCTIMFLIHPD